MKSLSVISFFGDCKDMAKNTKKQGREMDNKEKNRKKNCKKCSLTIGSVV